MEIGSHSARRSFANEWPTWCLVAAIYGGWLSLTALQADIPGIVLFALGGWFTAWHGSLQHETIHRHPTRSDALNALVGGWPLSLWLPYRIYRREHRRHHATARPSEPSHDPESRYLLPSQRWARRFANLEATLSGRLVFGPILAVGRFAVGEIERIRHEPRRFAADWSWHMAGLVAVLAWLRVCELTLGTYLFCFVLPGQMLTLLRGYAEHRADSAGPSRAVTVFSRGPLAWLFLNNNLHAAHHWRPDAPWHHLPAVEAHRTVRAEPRYAGYRAVIARFWWRRHDWLVHPAAVRDERS